MTTYNHTDITTGAAANAATFNAPMGELDAAIKLNKTDATTAPTVNEDSGDGYSVGSYWIDVTNDRFYVCVDSTVGAAVWRRMVASGVGQMIVGDGTEKTIAAGVITVTASYHTVDTEADAASDDLDTINGGVVGQLLVLNSANAGRDTTVKNGTGNIYCGSDRILSTVTDMIVLIYIGTTWRLIAFADNA